MFGKKLTLEEGAYVFSTKKNGNYYDFIFGVVTGVDDRKVGITGVIVNPVGLKNKIKQGKTGLTIMPFIPTFLPSIPVTTPKIKSL